MKLKLTVFFLLGLSLGILLLAGNEAQSQTSQQKARLQRAKGPDEETTRSYFTDLPLFNQDGRRVRFYTDVLKDRVVLFSFIYTNCRDACPLLVYKLLQVKERLGNLFGKPVYFVSMSVDPIRDTPEALAKYAKQQKAEHPGWVFLTGDKRIVDTILSKLGQYTPSAEAHSTLFLAGNVATRHWMKISPVTPPEAIALKLQDLASESVAIGSSRASATSGQKRD